MYAVVREGGRQLRVQQGDRVRVDHKPDIEAGAELRLAEVLLVGGAEGEVRVGTPTVEGAAVVARVVEETAKGDKIVVFKKRRRKNSKQKNGHRQRYTTVQIESIEV